jgi:hypothetical protein
MGVFLCGNFTGKAGVLCQVVSASFYFVLFFWWQIYRAKYELFNDILFICLSLKVGMG